MQRFAIFGLIVRIVALPCAAAVLAAPASAADAAHPIRITKAQIAGAIFQDYKPVVKTEDGNTTHDVEFFPRRIGSSMPACTAPGKCGPRSRRRTASTSTCTSSKAA
jgi:hypothetical protein